MKAIVPLAAAAFALADGFSGAVSALTVTTFPCPRVGRRVWKQSR